MQRFGLRALRFLAPVVTLVCGWMRICTSAAAAPASRSTTVVCPKPMTFESWTWRLGRSVEDHVTCSLCPLLLHHYRWSPLLLTVNTYNCRLSASLSLKDLGLFVFSGFYWAEMKQTRLISADSQSGGISTVDGFTVGSFLRVWLPNYEGEAKLNFCKTALSPCF